MSSLWAQFWAARYPPADPVHISYKDKTVLVTGTFRYSLRNRLGLISSCVDKILTPADISQVPTPAWAMRLLLNMLP